MPLNLLSQVTVRGRLEKRFDKLLSLSDGSIYDSPVENAIDFTEGEYGDQISLNDNEIDGFKGIADLLSGRHKNAIIQMLAVYVVTGLGFWFGLEAWEWCVIVLCFMIVLALEAVNTAIEYTIDLISPEQHPLAGKAKDMAAAAVLIAAIGTVIIAGIIFGTRVWI